MTFKKLIAAAGASALYFVSTAFAATPVVTTSHTAVKVACPTMTNSAPPVLKIQRLSASNHGVIKESIVTKSGPGITVNGRIFILGVDSRGDSAALGHLPGLFVLTCHHSNNRLGDAVFKGEIK